jgi:hypothetical protein
MLSFAQNIEIQRRKRLVKSPKAGELTGSTGIKLTKRLNSKKEGNNTSKKWVGD